MDSDEVILDHQTRRMLFEKLDIPFGARNYNILAKHLGLMFIETIDNNTTSWRMLDTRFRIVDKKKYVWSRLRYGF